MLCAKFVGFAPNSWAKFVGLCVGLFHGVSLVYEGYPIQVKSDLARPNIGRVIVQDVSRKGDSFHPVTSTHETLLASSEVVIAVPVQKPANGLIADKMNSVEQHQALQGK